MPRSLIAYQLFSAMPPLESANVLVSIMMSVGWSSKGKQLKLRHHDISRAHSQGTAQMLIYVRLPAEDRQTYGEDRVGRLVKSMYGTPDAAHSWQLGSVNLVCENWAGSDEANTVQHCSTMQALMWGWQCSVITSCAWQTNMDSTTLTYCSKQKTLQKTWDH